MDVPPRPRVLARASRRNFERLDAGVAAGFFDDEFMRLEDPAVTSEFFEVQEIGDDMLAKKDSAALMSSPVLGVLCTLDDDRPSQIKVGQVYERLSLLAAAEHRAWWARLGL